MTPSLICVPRWSALLVALAAFLALTAHAAPPVDEPAPAVQQLVVPSRGLLQQARQGASELVVSAMNFLGVPYRRGGQGDNGFDCSGFTRHVFETAAGLVLPRRAVEQARLATLAKVDQAELKPGDLVFFNTMRRAFSHVGIYVGDGKFIHAPRPGGEVRIEDMHDRYWAQRFNGGRRAELQAAPAR